MPREEAQSLLHGHRKHFVDVPALVFHIEDRGLVARSIALLAGKFHVCEKLHFHGHCPIAIANIAATARNVERKMSRSRAMTLGLRLRRKKFTNMIERFDVRHRIRPRRSSNGRLIHQHNVVQPIRTFQFAIEAGGIAALVDPQRVRHRAVEHIVDQR